MFSSLAHYYTSDAKEYTFYLNICGEVEAKVCHEKQAAVCQVKKTDSTQVKVAGRFQNQTLRYSDGDLTLIYFGGEECSSGFQRMTVINFECSETAGERPGVLPVLCVDGRVSWEWNAARSHQPSSAGRGRLQSPDSGGVPRQQPTHPVSIFLRSVCFGSGPSTRPAGTEFLS